MGFMYGVVGVVCLVEPGAWEIVVGLSVGNKFVVAGVVGFTTGTTSNLVSNSYEICCCSSLNVVALLRPAKETKDVSTLQQDKWKVIAEIELVNLNNLTHKSFCDCSLSYFKINLLINC